ncbi:hypothetical protein C8Q72DRAFT_946631 [Fomitopsis betulina]|nr:hypothetical protein C8Q72DRAFT_946631 [Fomitopsis betulina]
MTQNSGLTRTRIPRCAGSSSTSDKVQMKGGGSHQEHSSPRATASRATLRPGLLHNLSMGLLIPPPPEEVAKTSLTEQEGEEEEEEEEEEEWASQYGSGSRSRKSPSRIWRCDMAAKLLGGRGLAAARSKVVADFEEGEAQPHVWPAGTIVLTSASFTTLSCVSPGYLSPPVEAVQHTVHRLSRLSLLRDVDPPTSYGHYQRLCRPTQGVSGFGLVPPMGPAHVEVLHGESVATTEVLAAQNQNEAHCRPGGRITASFALTLRTFAIRIWGPLHLPIRMRSRSPGVAESLYRPTHPPTLI